MPNTLPLGPWKETFSGNWSGYEITMYENPDKLTLITIYEKKDEKVTGVLVLMNRYYVVEGEMTRLAESLEGYSIIFEKHYPTYKAKYFSVSSGPRYVKPELLNTEVEEIYNQLQEESEKILELSRAYKVNLVELKNAKEEYAARLFAEPIILPSLIFRRAPQAMQKIEGPKVLIGTKLTGEKAEEPLQSFSNTIIIGNESQAAKAMQVILENCVLNGVTCITLDENDAFANMSVPNKNFDYSAYPDLQPIGMPIKTIEPGQISIDLNTLDTAMFREIVNIPRREEEYAGKQAIELIDGIIEQKNLRDLSDIEEKLLMITDDSKKFQVYRAARWIKIMKAKYPDYFRGKIDPKTLVSGYMKTMGSIIRINLKNQPRSVKKAFAYSIIKSIYDEHKESNMSPELSVIFCMQNGKQYAPYNAKTRLENALFEILADSSPYGIGFCLGAENEVYVNHDLAGRNTMKMNFVSTEEVAVKEQNSRPYRMTLRPNLSA